MLSQRIRGNVADAVVSGTIDGNIADTLFVTPNSVGVALALPSFTLHVAGDTRTEGALSGSELRLCTEDVREGTGAVLSTTKATVLRTDYNGDFTLEATGSSANFSAAKTLTLGTGVPGAVSERVMIDDNSTLLQSGQVTMRTAKAIRRRLLVTAPNTMSRNSSVYDYDDMRLTASEYGRNFTYVDYSNQRYRIDFSNQTDIFNYTVSARNPLGDEGQGSWEVLAPNAANYPFPVDQDFVVYELDDADGQCKIAVEDADSRPILTVRNGSNAPLTVHATPGVTDVLSNGIVLMNTGKRAGNPAVLTIATRYNCNVDNFPTICLTAADTFGTERAWSIAANTVQSCKLVVTDNEYGTGNPFLACDRNTGVGVGTLFPTSTLHVEAFGFNTNIVAAASFKRSNAQLHLLERAPSNAIRVNYGTSNVFRVNADGSMCLRPNVWHGFWVSSCNNNDTVFDWLLFNECNQRNLRMGISNQFKLTNADGQVLLQVNGMSNVGSTDVLGKLTVFGGIKTTQVEASNITVDSNVNVMGNITAAGSITSSNSMGCCNLTVAVRATTHELTVNNTASVGGTLQVTGATTASTITASGDIATSTKIIAQQSITATQDITTNTGWLITKGTKGWLNTDYTAGWEVVTTPKSVSSISNVTVRAPKFWSFDGAANGFEIATSAGSYRSRFACEGSDAVIRSSAGHVVLMPNNAVSVNTLQPESGFNFYVNGSAKISSTLYVSGNVTIPNTLTVNKIAVNGTATSNALFVNGTVRIPSVLNADTIQCNDASVNTKLKIESNAFVEMFFGAGENIQVGGTTISYHKHFAFNGNCALYSRFGDVILRTGDGPTSKIFNFSRAGVLYAPELYSDGEVTSTSDIRVKRELVVVSDALHKVGALNGYTYKRTDCAANKRCAGLIAQEVQAVLPEVVKEEPDTGLLSIAYGNLACLFVEAIKELHVRVAALERRGA